MALDMDNSIAQFDLMLTLPGAQRYCTAINLSLSEFDLSPLPRDREVTWCVDSHERTARLLIERRRVVEVVSRHLAASLAPVITDAIKQQDTINGWPPQRYDPNIGPEIR